jgi:hypothetical protein
MGFREGQVSMNLRTLVAPVLGFFAVILALGACADTPTSPQNHRPVILSLAAFPEVARASDSILVVCQAVDADSDTLVYDWITDGRLRIRDARKGEHSLYNTRESFMVLYPVPTVVHVPVDTPWVQVFARDRRGMSAQQVVRFIVRS